MASSTSLLAGINPPLPSGARRSEGSRLLTLIRQLEQRQERNEGQNEDRPTVSLLEECVEVLDRLVASCQRTGLLGEDPELADQVLASSSTNSSSRKRGRHGGGSGHNSTNDASSLMASGDAGVTTTTTLDVNLVLQGLVRIMTWNASSDQYLLMVLVGDYLTAASEYAQARRSSKASSRCSHAELELLNRFPLVTSLQSFLQNALAALKPASSGLYTIRDDETTAAIAATLRSSASLVRLLTTRLSRSSLDGLAIVSWQGLAVTDAPEVRLGAAILLSTLPLQRTAASERWSQVWDETTSALLTALATLAPVVDVSIPSESTIVIPSTLKSWIEAIHRCSLERDRMESFLLLMAGLIRVLRCLLGDSQPSLPPTLVVQLDVSELADLVETILSFGAAAEAAYFGTKKRLRAETIGSGALSANGVAQIANSVKVLGLQLLATAIQALGCPCLLPFSDRLYRIVSVAVKTSTSTSLRSALEPLVGLDTKKRWLQCSLPVRTEATHAFTCCLITLGCQLSGSADVNPREFDSTLTLVAGTLVELLQVANVPDAAMWGTFSERSQLFESCARCLKAALVSSGEFLIIDTRRLIDSAIHTCLCALLEGTNSATPTSSVKKAILSMGTASVTTCWCDGAASSLSGSLENAARACNGDRDASVVLAATCALSTCSAVSTTRVPALSVVGATTNERDNFAGRVLSPNDLIERLESARLDALERLLESSKKVAEHRNQNSAADDHSKKATERIPALVHNTPNATNVDDSHGPSKASSFSDPSPTPTPEVQSIAEAPAPLVSDAADFSAKKLSANGIDEDDEDDDFPMIVDAEPDEDDIE